jgi:4-hydroxy-3-methylbut-2-enyl diphosphate reductase
MQIIIDDNAGFCFGVVKAIGTAEEELSHSGSLYCLGDIVHNTAEVARLKAKGLQVIDHGELRNLAPGGSKVMIRAHGEPPATYRLIDKLGLELIDATCPIVLALQQRIRRGYEEMSRLEPKGQVVIFGKPGHAEVVGLCGQTEGEAVVVSSPDDVEGIDFTRPIRLYSQTTKNKEEYQRLIENVKKGIASCGLDVGENHFVAYDTICNRVANRARELETFARSVDVLLFVAGANSSNGHYLYEYCRKVQPRTHLIADAGDLQGEWFEGARSVGISGATSTPRWLMEEVAKQLRVKN